MSDMKTRAETRRFILVIAQTDSHKEMLMPDQTKITLEVFSDYV